MVVTFGVFDLFHFGHENLFRRAKKLGDYLIVAVQDDKNVLKNKPSTRLINNLDKRMENVRSCMFVDRAIAYTQIDEDISKINFDVLVVGPDQTNEHFVKAIEWCKRNGKNVIVLERTEGISSSMLRENIK